MRDLVTKTGKRGRALNPRAALIVAIVVAATCFGLRKLHDKQFSATLTFLRNAAFAELEKKDYRAAQKTTDAIPRVSELRSGSPRTTFVGAL